MTNLDAFRARLSQIDQEIAGEHHERGRLARLRVIRRRIAERISTLEGQGKNIMTPESFIVAAMQENLKRAEQIKHSAELKRKRIRSGSTPSDRNVLHQRKSLCVASKS